MILCLFLHAWNLWSDPFTVPCGEGSRVYQRRQCERCRIQQYKLVAP